MKFTRGRGVTKQRDPRYVLDQERFDLNLTAVRTEDAGEYSCLVNNKMEGQDRVRLTVVGKQVKKVQKSYKSHYIFSTNCATISATSDWVHLSHNKPCLDQAPPK